jgi:hypothetical protein
MSASIARVPERITKRQCEIGGANNKLLKFHKDMISVGNKVQANYFFPTAIVDSDGKGAVKKAATRVDTDNGKLI